MQPGGVELGDGGALAYARLLELVVVARLGELRVLAELTGDLEPHMPDLPPPPPRRSVRRRP